MRQARSTTAFFPNTSQEEQAAQTFSDRKQARQDEREEETSAQSQDLGEREDAAATQDLDEREEDAATQDLGEREEDAATQDLGEREEEAATQDLDEREEEAATQDLSERDEETPVQSVVGTSRIRPRVSDSAEQVIQRTMGDGHDLTASRFSGDLRLEAAFDNERTVRRGNSGVHVTRLQQALVELGFQLPGVGVDGEFGPETEQAVRDYQSANGLAVDGVVGPQTMGDLDRRLMVPTFNWPNSLRDQIRALIAQGGTYVQMRPVIRNASFVERLLAAFDQVFLREIQAQLAWNDFARIVELLGRTPPDGNTLMGDAAVQASMADAWTDSNPTATSWDVEDPAHPSHATCSPSVSALPRAVTTDTHEEGGWIYFNVITGGIYTRRAPRGAQASIPLANPPEILDSIVVGAFHTHPNLGACWGVRPGAGDVNFSRFVGVPLLARGMQGAANQDFVTQAPAPQRRAHLAGPRGYPLAGGAIAPQIKTNMASDATKLPS